jgi:hypothetical protein
MFPVRSKPSETNLSGVAAPRTFPVPMAKMNPAKVRWSLLPKRSGGRRAVDDLTCGIGLRRGFHHMVISKEMTGKGKC